SFRSRPRRNGATSILRLSGPAASGRSSPAAAFLRPRRIGPVRNVRCLMTIAQATSVDPSPEGRLTALLHYSRAVAGRLLERLASGPPIVADGGLGALISDAVPRLRCPEEANLRAPESVVSVHVAYIRAGAELIETNSFGANRPKLAAHFLEDEFEQINSTAVRLAREAREVTGADVFIAGSIGPLGD